MRHRIDKQTVLFCMPPGGPDGPIAPYLSSFAQYLREQGYEHHYLRRQVMLAACFSHWIKQTRGGSCCDIRHEDAARYLKTRHENRQPTEGDPTALDHLIAFLRTQGVIPKRERSTALLVPAERCVQSYARYLRQDRALAEATIINYVPFIREFLKDRFGHETVKLSCLRAEDIIRFVRHRARHLHVKRAKLMTTALRSFFQYARMKGEVTLDLVAAVPIVASWSMTSIPRAIAPDQTKKLLASINRNTIVGRRDYAIVLLLARLGLGAGEVVSLELDDIDWGSGQLTVRRKRGRCSDMPLPADVGKAIAAYLRHGRPKCASRRVFLRTKAPIRGFDGPSAISSLIRHNIERAGVTAPTHGAHQFRHGLASDMLKRGASLSEIGSVLGHQHPDTTRIYTKIDVKSLRTLAQPWPRGVR
jgi:site-specific recombinase XerD